MRFKYTAALFGSGYNQTKNKFQFSNSYLKKNWNAWRRYIFSFRV